MKITELYNDYNLPIAEEGDRHYQPGWVNTPCPFCTGNPGNHLGYNKDKNYFYCWRCGFKKKLETISKLLLVPMKEAKKIIRQYSGREEKYKTKNTNKLINIHPLHFPTNTIDLKPGHKKYLKNRGFNPEQLQEKWNIKGTDIVSRLDDIDYSRRILIPIHWDKKLISFQTRDITGKHVKKYMNCPKKRQKINQKTILYGKQEKWTDVGICVEGVFDVWRFGINSFATFGIDWKREQMLEIVKQFKQVYICYDIGFVARQRAKTLAGELNFRGVWSKIIPLEDDPGSMSQEQADEFIEKLIK